MKNFIQICLPIFLSTLFINFSPEEIIEVKEKNIIQIDSLKQEINSGKILFKSNCASCHNINVFEDLIGPALHGVTLKWSIYPKKDLYNYIRNAEKMVKEEHPRALELKFKWKYTNVSFPNLSDKDIQAILTFIESS